jgi:hypothetical protein
MKDSSFHIRWRSFALGVVLGIFGFLYSLFAREEKRDKIYSSLLGCAVSMAINLIILKFAGPIVK